MTAKYMDDNKNCYQIFQRRKLCLNEEEIDDLFCFKCLKTLVFHILYFDFIIIDKKYENIHTFSFFDFFL